MPVTNRPIWDKPNALHLPALTEQVEADVCVVGLGGSGLACIRELLDHGQRVVGVDAVVDRRRRRGREWRIPARRARDVSPRRGRATRRGRRVGDL